MLNPKIKDTVPFLMINGQKVKPEELNIRADELIQAGYDCYYNIPEGYLKSKEVEEEKPNQEDVVNPNQEELQVKVEKLQAQVAKLESDNESLISEKAILEAYAKELEEKLKATSTTEPKPEPTPIKAEENLFSDKNPAGEEKKNKKS